MTKRRTRDGSAWALACLLWVLVGCTGVPLAAPEVPHPVMFGPVKSIPDGQTPPGPGARRSGDSFRVVASANHVSSSNGSYTQTTSEVTLAHAMDFAVVAGAGLEPNTMVSGSTIDCKSMVVFALFAMGTFNSCGMTLDAVTWNTPAAESEPHPMPTPAPGAPPPGEPAPSGTDADGEAPPLAAPPLVTPQGPVAEDGVPGKAGADPADPP